MKLSESMKPEINRLMVNPFSKCGWLGINKQALSWTLFLTCLFSSSVLFAQQEATAEQQSPAVVNRLRSIPALSFTYFQGTAQWLDTQGLIEGASSNPSLTGIASVSLPSFSVVTDFNVCGRDFASDQEFAGDLYRKSTDPANSAFLPPDHMAHVNSGISFFSDKMLCLKATVPATLATINNKRWTYYVELTIGSTVEVIDVKVGLNCPTGSSSC